MASQLYTSDIIKACLTSNNEIEYIHIHQFEDSIPLQSRIESLSPFEEKQVLSAIKTKELFSIPFWESLMLTFNNNKNFSKRILDAVITHTKRKRERINKYDFISETENMITMDINFAFNSEIITKSKKRLHLPLLDFYISVSEENQKVVECIIAALNMKNGYLLISGKSYHFIGSDLITRKELIIMLSSALHFAPIIDKSWLAHQLFELSCSLRFTKKYGILPSLIKIIGKPSELQKEANS